MTGNGKTSSFGYDEAGRRTNAVGPNATTTAYHYDDANQLLEIAHSGPGDPFASFQYAYDLSGNRTNMTTLEGVNSYTYDARNWLTSASYPDGRTQEFEYDPVGNRTLLVESDTGVPPVETAYTYGPVNRLLESASPVQTNVYTYDNAGRLILQAVDGDARSYAYSFRSQMTELIDTTSDVFAYDFDGDGNRINQSLNDCLTARFVYDGADVILDLNENGDVVHAYVNGPGIDNKIERISFINGEPRLRHVYHMDAVGSVIAMTDENQDDVKSYTYEAFGAIREDSGEQVINRYTYTGRESLGDSLGFYFYRNRVMDPHTGRFISGDPIGFRDGPNLYGYVRSNPLNRIDPWGLDSSGGPPGCDDADGDGGGGGENGGGGAGPDCPCTPDEIETKKQQCKDDADKWLEERLEECGWGSFKVGLAAGAAGAVAGYRCSRRPDLAAGAGLAAGGIGGYTSYQIQKACKAFFNALHKLWLEDCDALECGNGH